MIEVDGLTRYYGTKRALEDVSFAIEDRAIVGFLGLNGAGKSTLLRILGGLLLPSDGDVHIDGVDATQAPDSLRRRIGFLPEDPPLYDNMQVADFLQWCGEVKGASAETVERRLPEIADVCAIDDVLDRVVETLSHGYRKRVGIAQAIVHDPELVILDEPISGLDPVQIVEMRDVLERLREDRTVLVSSHILSEISETCDRILVLHEGRLVADGTQEELFEQLGAAMRLELTVRGEPEAIEAVVTSLDAIEHWSHEPTDDDLHELEVAMADDRREALVAALVERGVGVRRIEEAESELEQIFLDVTGEDEDLPEATDREEAAA